MKMKKERMINVDNAIWTNIDIVLCLQIGCKLSKNSKSRARLIGYLSKNLQNIMFLEPLATLTLYQHY